MIFLAAAGDVENWAEHLGGDQWATEFARTAGGAAGAAGPRTRQEGYQFAADNPYMDDADSFAKVSTKQQGVTRYEKHELTGQSTPSLVPCSLLSDAGEHRASSGCTARSPNSGLAEHLEATTGLAVVAGLVQQTCHLRRHRYQ